MYSVTEDGVLPFETNTSGVDDELINENSVRSTVHVSLPSTSSVEPAIPQSLPQAQPPPQTQPLPPEEQEPIEPLAPVTELDSIILEIFGDDPSVVKQYGKEIQADLAVRLQHIASNGLSKETSKELCEKYLPPSNCTLIDAPELNPEIKAAVSEAIQKTKIDKLLFGADLAETLKTAKAITKSGTDLKTSAPPNNKPTFPKNKTPLQQATTLPQRNNLNWKAQASGEPAGQGACSEDAARQQFRDVVSSASTQKQQPPLESVRYAGRLS
ncbi:hypothetical protein MSG28_004037 [Choristoneura fumiferana]|uniref:Uncharacterized protein n=1 Tax=Choristoneura fumiferana TaxID=7141 RepID=A0ACC0KHN5_CHOFU|nr:hypothetical protein MSG28_004037 [Choristoneura fumiferana]